MVKQLTDLVDWQKKLSLMASDPVEMAEALFLSGRPEMVVVSKTTVIVMDIQILFTFYLSATQSGSKPWYLEECSSTLATTYSSGSPGTDQNIVTVDMDTRYRKSLNSGEPVTQYLCTQSHTGTSASAPIAAGIVALALEANPHLTWRDMQHLVVLTSRHEGLRWESGWQMNGVGRRFSHKFGYGLMDAAAMASLARNWRNVARQRVCETETVS